MKLNFTLILFIFIGVFQLTAQEGPTPFECRLRHKAITTPATDCDGTNGSVAIWTKNAPPFMGGISQGPNSPTSNTFYSVPMNFNGLAPGTYSYYFEDIDGCIIRGTFTIEDNTNECCDFDIAEVEITNANGEFPFGRAEFLLEGGTPPYSNTANPQSNDEGYFYFSPLFPGFYEITFIDGNGCEITFAFEISSFAPDDNSSKNLNSRSNSEKSSVTIINNESITVYPNPVQNILNITNATNDIDYQIVRITENTGKEVLSSKVTNTSQSQIDASALSQGMYLIEITDNMGNKSLQRFLKMN